MGRGRATLGQQQPGSEARGQGAIICPSAQGTGCATLMVALQEPSPCTLQQLLLRAVPTATQVASLWLTNC